VGDTKLQSNKFLRPSSDIHHVNIYVENHVTKTSSELSCVAGFPAVTFCKKFELVTPNYPLANEVAKEFSNTKINRVPDSLKD
jgi:hypothetical protein